MQSNPVGEKDMMYMSKLFLYWSMVMNIELLECRFVPSLGTGDYSLICPRGLPNHVKDMVELECKHPGIYKEFLNGNFLVQKSRKHFSLIPKYHSYEQTTKIMKSDGGISTSMIILTLSMNTS